MAPAKFVTEFIGTFFLVLTIGLVVLNTTDAAAMFAPLAIGVALAVVVYMGGHVSGAHYNPAVSLGLFLRGDLKAGDMFAYWVAQLIGACLAAIVVSLVIPNTAGEGALANNYFGPAIGADWTMQSAGPWLIEILFTFLLMLVIFNVAVSSSTSGNSYFGLAIGFTVMVGAYAGGHISGGAFNPAVGLGPNLIKATMGGDANALGSAALYIVGPIAGAALAVIVFKIQESFLDSQKT